MQATAGLAGFFAAHGVWNVAAQQPINPMVAFDNVDGERCMVPFGDESNDAAVNTARAESGRQIRIGSRSTVGTPLSEHILIL